MEAVEEADEQPESRRVSEAASSALSLEEGLSYVTYELLAALHIDKTGLSFGQLPPEPVVVRRVAPGGWADESGVVEGDELVALNGEPVPDMTSDEFTEFMQVRPLRLTFEALRHLEDSDASGSGEGEADAAGATSSSDALRPGRPEGAGLQRMRSVTSIASRRQRALSVIEEDGKQYATVMEMIDDLVDRAGESIQEFVEGQQSVLADQVAGRLRKHIDDALDERGLADLKERLRKLEADSGFRSQLDEHSDHIAEHAERLEVVGRDLDSRLRASVSSMEQRLDEERVSRGKEFEKVQILLKEYRVSSDATLKLASECKEDYGALLGLCQDLRSDVEKLPKHEDQGDVTVLMSNLREDIEKMKAQDVIWKENLELKTSSIIARRESDEQAENDTSAVLSSLREEVAQLKAADTSLRESLALQTSELSAWREGCDDLPAAFSNLREEVEKLKTSIADLSGDMEKKEATIAGLQTKQLQEASNAPAVLRSLSEEIVKMQAADTALREELAKMQAADTALREDISKVQVADAALMEDMAKIQAADTALREDIAKMQVADTALREDMSKIQAAHITLREDLPKMMQARDAPSREDLAKMQEAGDALRDELAKMQAGDAALRKDLAEMQEADDALRDELAKMQAGDAALRKDIAKMQEADDAVRDQLARMQARDTALREDIAKIQAEDSSLRQEVGKQASDLDSWRQECNGVPAALSGLNDEIEKLKTANAALSADLEKQMSKQQASGEPLAVVNELRAELAKESDASTRGLRGLQDEIEGLKATVSDAAGGSEARELSERLQGAEQKLEECAALPAMLKSLRETVDQQFAAADRLRDEQVEALRTEMDEIAAEGEGRGQQLLERLNAIEQKCEGANGWRHVADALQKELAALASASAGAEDDLAKRLGATEKMLQDFADVPAALNSFRESAEDRFGTIDSLREEQEKLLSKDMDDIAGKAVLVAERVSLAEQQLQEVVSSRDLTAALQKQLDDLRSPRTGPGDERLVDRVGEVELQVKELQTLLKSSQEERQGVETNLSGRLEMLQLKLEDGTLRKDLETFTSMMEGKIASDAAAVLQRIEALEQRPTQDDNVLEMIDATKAAAQGDSTALAQRLEALEQRATQADELLGMLDSTKAVTQGLVEKLAERVGSLEMSQGGLQAHVEEVIRSCTMQRERLEAAERQLGPATPGGSLPETAAGVGRHSTVVMTDEAEAGRVVAPGDESGGQPGHSIGSGSRGALADRQRDTDRRLDALQSQVASHLEVTPASADELAAVRKELHTLVQDAAIAREETLEDFNAIRQEVDSSNQLLQERFARTLGDLPGTVREVLDDLGWASLESEISQRQEVEARLQKDVASLQQELQTLSAEVEERIEAEMRFSGDRPGRLREMVKRELEQSGAGLGLDDAPAQDDEEQAVREILADFKRTLESSYAKDSSAAMTEVGELKTSLSSLRDEIQGTLISVETSVSAKIEHHMQQSREDCHSMVQTAVEQLSQSLEERFAVEADQHHQLESSLKQFETALAALTPLIMEPPQVTETDSLAAIVQEALPAFEQRVNAQLQLLHDEVTTAQHDLQRSQQELERRLQDTASQLQRMPASAADEEHATSVWDALEKVNKQQTRLKHDLAEEIEGLASKILSIDTVIPSLQSSEKLLKEQLETLNGEMAKHTTALGRSVSDLATEVAEVHRATEKAGLFSHEDDADTMEEKPASIWATLNASSRSLAELKHTFEEESRSREELAKSTSTRFEEWESRLDDVRKDCGTKAEEIEKATSVSVASLRTRLDDVIATCGNDAVTLQVLQADVEVLQADITSVRTSTAEILALKESEDPRAADLQSELEALESSQQKADARVAALQSEIEALHSSSEQAEVRLSSLNSELEDLRADRASFQTEVLRQLQGSQQEVDGGVADLHSNLEALESSQQKADARLAALHSEIEAIQGTQEQVDARVSGLNMELEAFRSDRVNLRSEVRRSSQQQMDSCAAELRSDLEALQASLSKLQTEVQQSSCQLEEENTKALRGLQSQLEASFTGIRTEVLQCSQQQMDSRVAALQSELEVAKSDMSALIKTLSDLAAERQQDAMALQELQQEVQDLEASRDNGSTAMKALTKDIEAAHATFAQVRAGISEATSPRGGDSGERFKLREDSEVAVSPLPSNSNTKALQKDVSQLRARVGVLEQFTTQASNPGNDAQTVEAIQRDISTLMQAREDFRQKAKMLDDGASQHTRRLTSMEKTMHMLLTEVEAVASQRGEREQQATKGRVTAMECAVQCLREELDALREAYSTSHSSSATSPPLSALASSGKDGGDAAAKSLQQLSSSIDSIKASLSRVPALEEQLQRLEASFAKQQHSQSELQAAALESRLSLLETSLRQSQSQMEQSTALARAPATSIAGNSPPLFPQPPPTPDRRMSTLEQSIQGLRAELDHRLRQFTEAQEGVKNKQTTLQTAFHCIRGEVDCLLSLSHGALQALPKYGDSPPALTLTTGDYAALSPANVRSTQRQTSFRLEDGKDPPERSTSGRQPQQPQEESFFPITLREVNQLLVSNRRQEEVQATSSRVVMIESAMRCMREELDALKATIYDKAAMAAFAAATTSRGEQIQLRAIDSSNHDGLERRLVALEASVSSAWLRLDKLSENGSPQELGHEGLGTRIDLLEKALLPNDAAQGAAVTTRERRLVLVECNTQRLQSEVEQLSTRRQEELQAAKGRLLAAESAIHGLRDDLDSISLSLQAFITAPGDAQKKKSGVAAGVSVASQEAMVSSQVAETQLKKLSQELGQEVKTLRRDLEASFRGMQDDLDMQKWALESVMAASKKQPDADLEQTLQKVFAEVETCKADLCSSRQLLTEHSMVLTKDSLAFSLDSAVSTAGSANRTESIWMALAEVERRAKEGVEDLRGTQTAELESLQDQLNELQEQLQDALGESSQIPLVGDGPLNSSVAAIERRLRAGDVQGDHGSPDKWYIGTPSTSSAALVARKRGASSQDWHLKLPHEASSEAELSPSEFANSPTSSKFKRWSREVTNRVEADVRDFREWVQVALEKENEQRRLLAVSLQVLDTSLRNTLTALASQEATVHQMCEGLLADVVKRVEEDKSALNDIVSELVANQFHDMQGALNDLLPELSLKAARAVEDKLRADSGTSELFAEVSALRSQQQAIFSELSQRHAKVEARLSSLTDVAKSDRGAELIHGGGGLLGDDGVDWREALLEVRQQLQVADYKALHGMVASLCEELQANRCREESLRLERSKVTEEMSEMREAFRRMQAGHTRALERLWPQGRPPDAALAPAEEAMLSSPSFSSDLAVEEAVPLQRCWQDTSQEQPRVG